MEPDLDALFERWNTATGKELERRDAHDFESQTHQRYVPGDCKWVFKNIDDVGGEGEGEYRHIIFQIVNLETNEEYFLKFEGQYDSWNGTEWFSDGPWLVRPREKTIIVYE